jgi:hypothetical protein
MGIESFPFGMGERGFQNLPEEQKEQRVSFEEVKNKVEWVNQDILLPFKIEAGVPTKLGIFLSSQEKDHSVKVHMGHYRTALLARVIFEDKQGRRYRDLDAKGTGNLRSESYTSNVLVVDNENSKRSERSLSGPLGFCLHEYALHDRDITEELLAIGIRTYRIASIIKLEELIDNKGERISIAEAKQRGILDGTDNPVIELRAFTTKMRILDALEKPAFLEDGMRMVAQELNKTEINKDEYAHWFAKTLGEQVGRMHKSGYVHDYIKGNITLDCHIIDNDGVGRKAEMNSREFKTGLEKDILEAKQELLRLSEILKIPLNTFLEKFERAYKEELPKNFWNIFGHF